MIKFVILENNPKFQKDVVETLEKLMFNTNYEYKIEKYVAYNNKLQATIKDCSIRKVYILDIELANTKSGITIAEEIRKLDWDSEIIFITNHDQMFETAHRDVVKVFDFIEKFHQFHERFIKDIKLILEHETDYGKYTLANNKMKLQIYLKDITHIYRDTAQRKLIIQTSNNKFLVNMTISEILATLDERFIQVHRACIVNDDRVNHYCLNKGYFILDTKEQVNLCSKNFKDNVESRSR